MDATPPHWACCHGHADTVRFQLDRGTPTKNVDGYFGTPLHTTLHCQWGSDGDHARVLRHLLEGGCEVPDGAFPTGNSKLDEVFRDFEGAG
ncbi:MAG: hypothetical protein CMJ18_22560 [Phycisphaeraceae bacterium]|nr:hypothetical protein [Phycisphaeraceae bacterium]